jgi:adenylate kinase
MTNSKKMNEKNPLNFILTGRSGCGKGTQAELLKEHFKNLVHITTGDMFRHLVKQDTDIGKRVKSIVEAGGLPFDDLATTLWTHKIAFEVREEQGILADGFPRRLSEALDFDRLIDFMERKDSTSVILIDISRQEAFDRLTKRRICKECGNLIPWVGEFKNLSVCNECGGELITRRDDSPEFINNRLDYYDNEVSKVVDHYKKENLLIRVNGEQSIEEVFEEILRRIK